MSRIVSSILAVYIASFLFIEIPAVKTFATGKTPLALFATHIAIFLIFFVLAHIIINKLVFAESGRGAVGLLKTILQSIALAGLVLTVLYHIIPVTPLYALPSILTPFFVPTIAYTLWLTLPLILLFF